MKRKYSFLLIVVLMISLLGNGNLTNGAATSRKVSLSVKKVQMVVGAKKTIILKNAPSKVKWKVEDKKVAKIKKTSGNRKNKITIMGVKEGTTKISAKCGKKKYTVKVVVKKVEETKKVTDRKSGDKNATTTTVNLENESGVLESDAVNQVVTSKGNEDAETPSEEMTTKEETTTKETAKATFTLEVTNSPVQLGDDWQIKISSDIELQDDYREIMTGYGGGKLEIFENNQWTEMEAAYSIVQEIGIVFFKEFNFTIHMMKNESDIRGACGICYPTLREGHYRYSHMVGGEYISGEFDVEE